MCNILLSVWLVSSNSVFCVVSGDCHPFEKRGQEPGEACGGPQEKVSLVKDS